MPIFTSERLAKIPKDPVEGLKDICDLFESIDDENHQHGEGDINDYIEFYALLRSYCRGRGFNYGLDELQMDPNHTIDYVRLAFKRIGSEVGLLSRQKTAQKFESIFSSYFSGESAFELSDGDISEINRLTADLRNRITQTLDLEEKHKQRILGRLEAMQAEIHKKLSDFDRITGTMYEVLSVIKKAGESAEPWMRIVRQILIIVWASQGRVYELPSSAPMDFLSDENE